VTELLPELRRIVGMRNRIIHGYDSVDDEGLLKFVLETGKSLGLGLLMSRLGL
jgi:uncharacterized protein YutE (UPF0331/DUF86 family)